MSDASAPPLRDHCRMLGRPYASVLRSYLTWAIVAASADAMASKVDTVAPAVSPAARQGMFTGTADDMVAYYRGLIDAGHAVLHCGSQRG